MSDALAPTAQYLFDEAMRAFPDASAVEVAEARTAAKWYGAQLDQHRAASRRAEERLLQAFDELRGIGPMNPAVSRRPFVVGVDSSTWPSAPLVLPWGGGHA